MADATEYLCALVWRVLEMGLFVLVLNGVAMWGGGYCTPLR
ncbi:hypothetical protein [Leeia speluncae]|nr:hypothetical protein [Leeia speluncae]